MEVEIPNDVKVSVNEGKIRIEGKLGYTEKSFNEKLTRCRLEGSKLIIEPNEGKKLKKKALWAEKALHSEISKAIRGVREGIELKMKIVYAHFPISIEQKESILLIKNIFGERAPRVAKIMGSTKVEAKGDIVTIKGVDPYDIGQTVANIKDACREKGYDTRVFQDGIYVLREE
ncbi:MAG: hypothetical protein QXL16_00465 [Candidatus Micrarchaeaceae archaeon]